LQTSSRKAIELTWPRRNGEPLHVSSSVAPLRDEKGDIQGKVVIFADITSRRESEQCCAELVERERAASAQAKAERRFRELLDATPDAILEIDGDGRIVLLNEVAEKMFGYNRAELRIGCIPLVGLWAAASICTLSARTALAFRWRSA
jgi:PAS domain-containing protein